MRFLMLSWRDPGNPLAGGAERVSLGYLAGLVGRGHEVFWFANGFAGCEREGVFEGVRVVRGGGVGFSILRAWWWLRGQGGFDLVIDQFHGVPWFAPWWCGCRCVGFVHEVLGPIWGCFFWPPLSWLGRLQEGLVFWLYRGVGFWTGSAGTAEALRGFGVRDVRVVRYGVGTRRLGSLPVKCFVEPMRLVVVSRLAPNKRIGDVVEAVALLREGGRRVVLDVVGEGVCGEGLRRLAVRRGVGDCVVFRGWLSEGEKDVVLGGAHVLLHASVREGWGLNVVEAGCLGTPAVVYPTGGLVESTVDGVTGVVARAEAPWALAEGVERLFGDGSLYERCRVGGWVRGGEFHWDRVLPGVCDWLEGLARGEVV